MNKSPAIELLEPRQLLSGNVLAIVSGHNLTLKGDALDNGIDSVVQDGAAITITPDLTTSINGQPVNTPVTVNVPGLQLLTVQMGAGDDAVTVTGQTILGVDTPFVAARGVNANLGAGNDDLSLVGVTTRSIAVDAEDGDNDVQLNAFAGATATVPARASGNVAIRAEAGSDNFGLGGAIIGGNLSINLGGGALDSFNVAPGGIASFVGNRIGHNLAYSGSNGIDAIVFTGDVGARVFVGGNVRFALGGGGDVVIAADNAAMTVNGMLGIAGLAGSKVISLTDAVVHNGVGIQTGNGDDTIDVLGLQDASNLNIVTGVGNDNVSIDRGTVQAQTNVTGWTRVHMAGAVATLSMAHITGYSAILHGGKGVNTLNYDNLTINFNKLATLINFVV